MQHWAYSETTNNVKNGKGGLDIGIVSEGFLEHVNATSIDAPLCGILACIYWQVRVNVLNSWQCAVGAQPEGGKSSCLRINHRTHDVARKLKLVDVANRREGED